MDVSLQQDVMIDSTNRLFPSFAASPVTSPHRQQRQPFADLPLQKITINLPESLLVNKSQNSSIQTSLPQCKQAEGNNNIKVYCRFRPSLNQSSVRFDENMIDDGQNRYSYDHIFDKYSKQSDIFNSIGGRHVESFFKGHNSTIFTYGQTGSGKTFTMFGNLKESDTYGLIPRTLEYIFECKQQDDIITCSILQIYNQKLNDLFDPAKQSPEIKLKELDDSVLLEGMVEVRVQQFQQIMKLIRFGYRDRKIASTLTNDSSSRSHTILFVYRTFFCMGKQYKTKLCFIDLAGSEKVSKSGVQGINLEQAKKINLSLSCLGNVVSALTSSAQHIPYRNSKLTRILKDSLTGDCRTSIITTCSLEKSDYPETISTIKFAVRAKKIKNKKRLNNIEYTTTEIIEGLRKELAQTKKQLDFYKRKDQEVNPQEIPEEEVECRPIKYNTFNGNGISCRSKPKFLNAVSI